ncbi:L,D-transpeptidase [Ectothiorhodospiraceae bacterium BW-2]|nr:L,D-transpeptidase [Ectothiorhodospiraceae bacterium BW-2]
MAECELRIDLATQQLGLWQRQRLLQSYSVSTAIKGAGELQGSGATPRGVHSIRAKIGAGLAPNSVLVGRRPTGEIYSEQLRQRYPRRDWILSRILWLCGCERGKNRGGCVDTMRRYIYIHGTPDSEPMGIPASHGCIRMRNHDIIELFDRVAVSTRVIIEERACL